MPQEITPQANPTPPTSLTVGQPGEGVKAITFRLFAQAILDGFAWVNNTFWKRSDAVNADTLDGLDSSQFARAGSVSNSGGDAATLQGKAASYFLPADGKAVNASHADNADNAGHANNADNAGHADRADYAATAGVAELAQDAQKLGGRDPSAFLANAAVSGRMTYVRFIFNQSNNGDTYNLDKVYGKYASANFSLSHVNGGSFGEFILTHNLGAVQFALFDASNVHSVESYQSELNQIYMLWRHAGIKSGQTMSNGNYPDATMQYLRPAQFCAFIFDMS